MFVSVISVFLLCVLFLVIHWIRIKRYWANQNVIHETPNPLCGSLIFLLKRQNIFSWLYDYYNKFKHPYVGIWLCWKPALLINSPELAQRILVRDSDSFRNRLIKTSKTDLSSKSIVFLRDSAHQSLKRKLTPAFTMIKLKSIQNVLLRKSSELTQCINNYIKNGKLIDLRAMFSDYTTDIISITTFGVPSDATLTSASPLRQITKDFMKFDFLRGVSWACVAFFPAIADILRLELFPKESTDKLRHIFKAVVEERRAKECEGTYDKKQDFLYSLMKMKDDAVVSGEEIHDDVLLAQALFFLEAGFDTSAITLTHLIYEMAFAPDIQDKLLKELLDARTKIKFKEFESQTLSELVYLNCVIKETLRKYPPLPLLDRVASRDYKIDENLTVKKGTPVYINIVGLHYDADVYPEPQKFNPDRFITDWNLESTTFLPFGKGPRYCIGKHLGLQMIRCAVTAIALEFEIHPLPNSRKPSQCGFENKSIFLAPDCERFVKFVPRIT